RRAPPRARPGDRRPPPPQVVPPSPALRHAGRGLAVGGAAGLAFGAIEAGTLFLARPLAFDDNGERVRFAFIAVLLLFAAGVVSGALAGLADAGVRGIADRFAPRPA